MIRPYRLPRERERNEENLNWKFEFSRKASKLEMFQLRYVKLYAKPVI